MSQQDKTNLSEIWDRLSGHLQLPSSGGSIISPPDDGMRPASSGSPLIVSAKANTDEPIVWGHSASIAPYVTYSFKYVTSGIDLAEPPKPTIDAEKFSALKSAEARHVSRRVPDAVEVITGYRAWAVKNVDKGLRLAPLGSSSGKWRPKQMIVAKCDSHNGHPSPSKDCQCGIWAFKTADNLLAALQTKYTTSVIGQVSLWGRVIETENGFRAQYAYPKELWLFDNSLEELGYIYGVPVRTV